MRVSAIIRIQFIILYYNYIIIFFAEENNPRHRREMNASYKTRKLKKLQNVLPVKLPEVEPPTYKNKADLEIKLVNLKVLSPGNSLVVS